MKPTVSTNRQAFLDKLEAVKKPAELSGLINLTRLSEQEKEALQETLSEKRYRKKLETFRRQAAKARSDIGSPEIHAMAKRFERSKVKVLRDQKKLITKLNKEVRNRIKDRTAEAHEESGKRPPQPAEPAWYAATSDVFWGGFAYEAPFEISGYNPGNPYPGGDIMFYGEGFGTVAGEVRIFVGDTSTDCPITEWHNDMIDVRIPGELVPVVGESMKTAVAWITLPGDQTAGTPVTLYPNTMGRTPVIDTVSASTVRPGQLLLILGENFLSERRGSVELVFGRDVLPSSINVWMNSLISVQVDEDICGWLPRHGVLRVRNHFGFVAERAISFHPIEEIINVPLEGRLQGGAHCSRGFHGIDAEEPFAWTCMFGNRHEYHVSIWGDAPDMLNGWVIEDAGLDVRRRGINSGAHWTNGPRPGSTRRGGYRYEVWADGYSAADARPWIYVRGPRGTLPFEPFCGSPRITERWEAE